MSSNEKLTLNSIDGRCIITFTPWHSGLLAELNINSPISSTWSITIDYHHWNNWISALKSEKDIHIKDDHQIGSHTRVSSINEGVFFHSYDNPTRTRLEFGLSTEDALIIATELETLYNNPNRQRSQKEHMLQREYLLHGNSNKSN